MRLLQILNICHVFCCSYIDYLNVFNWILRREYFFLSTKNINVYIFCEKLLDVNFFRWIFFNYCLNFLFQCNELVFGEFLK